MNGSEASAISISGAEFSFDAETKLAKFIISDSGEPKLSANLQVTPASLTFNDKTPQTVTVTHLGDGVISFDLFNEAVASVKQVSNTGYAIYPQGNSSAQSSDLFWKLSETAEYYPANKGISIIDNFIVPATVLFQFNEDVSDYCEGDWEISDNYKFVDGKFGTAITQNSTSTPLYLTPANLYFGAKDFTFDFWSHFDGAQYQSYGLKIYASNYAGDYTITFYQSIQGGFTMRVVTPTQTFDEKITMNQTFIHSALLYQHELQKLTYYQDGVTKVAYDLELPRLSISKIEIGSPASQWRKEIVDELRFLDGVAAWTTDFTPPTQPYV